MSDCGDVAGEGFPAVVPVLHRLDLVVTTKIGLTGA
jgi:hypothetical protein